MIVITVKVRRIEKRLHRKGISNHLERTKSTEVQSLLYYWGVLPDVWTYCTDKSSVCSSR
jgi:hypothetical protein